MLDKIKKIILNNKNNSVETKYVERKNLVYGQKRVKKIAKKLDLPYWWIESVLVEYYDCRRYAEQGDIWTFDFTKLDKNIEKTILEKKVIVPYFYMIQNILLNDLSYRTFITLAGSPMERLEDADVVPEGLVNRTGFPSSYIHGNLEFDPKNGFFTHAIVLDNDIFYQWRIADTFPIPDKHYGWYKSKLFDLHDLFVIHRTLEDYRNSPEVKKPTQEFKNKIKDAYEKLEKIRQPLRQKILEYHDEKKIDYDPKLYTVPDPPTLSYFETIKLNKEGYLVRTRMEPLFLRSAIRNIMRAKTARNERINHKIKAYDSVTDEIEFSSMCIISAISCLESYINYVITKYLSEKSISIRKTRHIQKWVRVIEILNLNNKFKTDEKPFSDFIKLVTQRNNIIHYKSEYKLARDKNQTFSQSNLENAEISIKVAIDMIIKLSENSQIPLPYWIVVPQTSGSYWKDVSDYLKQYYDEKNHNPH